MRSNLRERAGKWLGIAREVIRAARRDDLLTYGAALAFHVMLALFPFLLFVIALVTLFDIPGVFERILRWSRLVLPPQAMQQVNDVVLRLQENRDTGVLSLGVVAAIWAASGGIRSAMVVLNRAYSIAVPRSTWRRYLVSLGYTLALGVLVLIVAALLFVGPATVDWLSDRLRLGGSLTTIWIWIRYPLLLALLIVLSALAYSLLPNGVPFRWITPGSVAAILIWLAASSVFRFYVSNVGRYNVVYGSVGAIIVLMLFIYISSLALLIGGELNAVLAADHVTRTDSVSEDHAVQPDHPVLTDDTHSVQPDSANS